MATSKAEEKKKYNQLYDKQAEQVNKNIDAGIKELSTAYDDQQRAIAVQKLVNERKVAESMANLGLTDSGLNRTQQTAVQLSAANAGYNLNRQKQADMAKYELDRSNQLAQIEQNRLATDIEIDNTYKQLEASAEKAQVEAASAIIGQNNAVLNRNFVGSLSQNGVSVEYDLENNRTTYIDRNTGYKSTFARTVNPYTNQDNLYGRGDTADAGREYGFFDNGYQPKGVVENGVKLGKLTSAGVTYFINGNMQNVHKTPDSRLWVWDGANNRYMEVQTTTSADAAFQNSALTTQNSDYYFSNGYQPRYVNDTKLVESGIKSDVLPSIFGIPTGQNIWKAGDKYYVWVGSMKNYVDVTSQITFKNGYQPAYMGTTKLKTAGTIKSTLGSYEDIPTNQNVWCSGSKYYIWNDKTKSYIDVTTQYNKYLNKKNKGTATGAQGWKGVW